MIIKEKLNLNLDDSNISHEILTGGIMRTVLFVTFLLLSTAIIKAQKPYDNINPDGAIGFLSFHITPYWITGNANINFEQGDDAQLDSPSKFGLNLKLKFPVSNKITVSTIYEFNKLNDEYFSEQNVNSYSLNGTYYKYGGTISFYMN